MKDTKTEQEQPRKPGRPPSTALAEDQRKCYSISLTPNEAKALKAQYTTLTNAILTLL